MANRNKAYWARRAKRTQDAILDRVFEEYVARVQEAYTDAIHAMDAKMRTWVQRLADNNEISYADAQKLLAKNELEEFHWSVEQYIKHGTDNLDGQWSKQLENASARVHISRYDAMKFELQALAKEATGKTIGAVKSAAELAYTESYNHTAFDLQQQVGVGISMQGVDSRKLEHVLNRPWSDDGKTFTARCWEGCDNLVSKVNRELFRMVATGEKPDRAIAAIADEFGKTKRTAGRLVMTESAAIASQAQHDCYTELGVEEFEVVGTFDAHMCDFCGEMDGKHFPESKRKIGENAPPFHPWCRCTTAPYDEDLKGVGTRWMRDPETGKGDYVPADMTYQEWKEIYVDKTSTLEAWEAKNVDNSGESSIIKEDDIYYAGWKNNRPHKEKVTGKSRYERVSDDYLNSLPQLSKPETYKEAVINGNKMNYINNCQRAAQAFEMRMRGFDVVASEMPLIDSIGYGDFKKVFLDTTWFTCLTDNPKNEIVKKVLEYPKSRFQISAIINNRGHVFSAVNHRGNCVFVDPTYGELDASYFFDVFEIKNVEYCRVDGKPISNLIKQCIEVIK